MLTISNETQKFLLKEYSKKHRHYHTYSHVCDVLDTLHENKENIVNFQATELAANFHDIVYEVGEEYRFNEQRSCLKFLEIIENDNPSMRYDLEDKDFQTAYLALLMIGATHGHGFESIRNHKSLEPDQINDISIFLDADLRILSRSRDKVIEFEEEIRKEFSIYSDEVYRSGRVAVLTSFLNRKKIYFSRIGFDWEEQARDNIKFLIARLTNV